MLKSFFFIWLAAGEGVCQLDLFIADWTLTVKMAAYGCRLPSICDLLGLEDCIGSAIALLNDSTGDRFGCS